MFEARWDGQQDLDGVFVRAQFVAATVEQGSESEDNQNERIAQNANEEEDAS